MQHTQRDLRNLRIFFDALNVPCVSLSATPHCLRTSSANVYEDYNGTKYSQRFGGSCVRYCKTIKSLISKEILTI